MYKVILIIIIDNIITIIIFISIILIQTVLFSWSFEGQILSYGPLNLLSALEGVI